MYSLDLLLDCLRRWAPHLFCSFIGILPEEACNYKRFACSTFTLILYFCDEYTCMYDIKKSLKFGVTCLRLLSYIVMTSAPRVCLAVRYNLNLTEWCSCWGRRFKDRILGSKGTRGSERAIAGIVIIKVSTKDLSHFFLQSTKIF